MAGGYIQVPPDSTGKKLNARYRAIEGTAGYEQYVAWQGLPTFYCLAPSVALAQNKHLFSIYNDAGSGYLIHVPRLSIVNMSLTSVTGVGVELDFMRTTSQSGGTVITPQKADTADVNLTAAIHIATGATIAEGALLWPVTLNNDEIPLTLNATPLPDIQGQEIDIDWAGQRIERVHFGLAGNYQLENLRLSLAAIMLLNESGFILTPQVLRDSLSHLKFPGRLEVLSRQPLVIADAAHNPHAAKALGESLNSILGAKKKILLCGYLDDKNAGEALAYLGENTSRCIVSRPESDRASKWNRVADEWNKIYPGTSCYVQEDIEKAVSLGVQLLDREEYLLITGSFYLPG
jgi:hypothetical protein